MPTTTTRSSWTAGAACAADSGTGSTGFVVDFFEIERVFQPVLNQLDHAYLNEIEGLVNPTAELIARWIWRRIKPELPILAAVVCYETPHCWAEYDGSGA